MDIVKRAQRLLRGITSGNWDCYSEGITSEQESGYVTKLFDRVYSDDDNNVCSFWGFVNPSDAAFIEEAPDLVKGLVQEVEQLRTENERLQKENELSKAVKECVNVALDHHLTGFTIQPPWHPFTDYSVYWIGDTKHVHHGFSVAIALKKLAKDESSYDID
jgi:hypothetical protein